MGSHRRVLISCPREVIDRISTIARSEASSAYSIRSWPSSRAITLTSRRNTCFFLPTDSGAPRSAPDRKYGLRRDGARHLTADGVEHTVDAGARCLHRDDSGQRDERGEQGVLDQVLSVLLPKEFTHTNCQQFHLRLLFARSADAPLASVRPAIK